MSHTACCDLCLFSSSAPRSLRSPESSSSMDVQGSCLGQIRFRGRIDPAAAERNLGRALRLSVGSSSSQPAILQHSRWVQRSLFDLVKHICSLRHAAWSTKRNLSLLHSYLGRTYSLPNLTSHPSLQKSTSDHALLLLNSHRTRKQSLTRTWHLWRVRRELTVREAERTEIPGHVVQGF